MHSRRQDRRSRFGTTAYITRNHGYMIYDTLFGMDGKGEIKPQMVEKHSESPDHLTFVFTLRDGLLWHDGAPVTSEDCRSPRLLPRPRATRSGRS